MPEKKKIAVIGSGNWGSAIARHVARNIASSGKLQRDYARQVDMWVLEEILKDGRKLTEAINTDHVNVKYLPQASLPANLVAKPDIEDAVAGASILILVPPHQFVRGVSRRIAKAMTPRQKREIICVSLAKGIEFDAKKKVIRRMTQVFQDETGVRDSQLAALSGANIANEVAADMFAETTIASPRADVREELHRLFHTDNFVVELSSDIAGVELGGALKNIVAVAAGVVDGLGYGNNTKAAIIKAGLQEMIEFGSYGELGHLSEKNSFLSSAGVGDLITTCFGGRNRMFGEQLGRLWKNDPEKAKKISLERLEEELLHGQKVQGVDTAKEVHAVLKSFGLLDEFPLFVSVYNVCFRRKDPRRMYRFFREKDLEVIDLRRFFEEKIEPYAMRQGEKYGVGYRTEMPARTKVLVSFNRFLLKAVVKRILGKAFRHAAPGGRVVASVSVSGEKLTVNVRNTGRGIPKNKLDEAYRKMGTTASIVELRGGTFHIKSKGKTVDMGFTLERA
ncbi:MAG: glycerol-3-phosphate dehydrogenase (NAD(+)) [bacterium]